MSPAPVDRAAIRGALEAGTPLPDETSTSPDVFEWERSHLFEGSWTYVCHRSEIGEAGDQLAATVCREGVLLARDRSGAVRAWRNICRHRGHELLAPGERANAAAIRCPYHAWVYGLEGDLRATPRFGDPEGFDRAGFPLLPIGVAELSGSVLVDTGAEAGSVEPDSADAQSFEDLAVTSLEEFFVDDNWKDFALGYLGGNGDGHRSMGLSPNMLIGSEDSTVVTLRLDPMAPTRTRVERRTLGAATDGVPKDPTPTREAGPDGVDEARRFRDAIARAYLGLTNGQADYLRG